MRDSRFQGVFPALATPFVQGDAVDWTAFDGLVARMLEGGVQGLVVCGSTGEAATLDDTELESIISRAVSIAAGQALVIGGVSSNSTRRAVTLARRMEAAGADAALLVTPFYNKPTQAGLEQHFTTVAQNTGLPIVLYNVPGRTASNILPATIESLAECDTLVAVKESSQNVSQVSELIERVGDTLSILSGDDPLTLPLMSIGAMGVVSVTANVRPKGVVDLVSAAKNHDWERARRRHFQLDALTRQMFCETNPIPVKFALSVEGLGDGTCRLPLEGLSHPGKKEAIRMALAAYDEAEQSFS